MGRSRNKNWASNIKKVEIDGHVFDSQREATRYNELVLLEKAGEIRDLKCHTKRPLELDGKPLLIRSKGFPNGRKASYTDDFSYEEKVDLGNHRRLRWELVVEDVKGYDKPIDRLRRSIFELLYNIEIKVVY